MKKIVVIFCSGLICCSMSAQEKYGNVLNLGLGPGYGAGEGGVALTANYEFDAAANFTVAPFIAISTYLNNYDWGNYYYPFVDYQYRETIIPIGAKGCYYFDDLLELPDKWDVYAGVSAGFTIRKITWNGPYPGPVPDNTSSGFSFAFHVGGRYHFNEKVGMFLDLSTDLSSIGVSFRLK